MDTNRDKTSLKGSQGNVAESTQPLLETLGAAGEAITKGTPERERIEIESAIPKGSMRDIAEQEAAEGGKRRLRTLSFIESFTMNMNLLDRDASHINDYINVGFEEVLAEPRANQSLDPIWKFAYVFFIGTKYWVYRGLAAACALPCGFFWGFIFSILTLISVWVISPVMRIVDVLASIIRRVWGSLIQAILDPIFQSAAQLREGRGNNKYQSGQDVV